MIDQSRGKSMRFRNWFFPFFFLLFCTTCCAAVKIIALGDALTAGTGVARVDSYPTKLRYLLAENGFPDLVLMNAGLSAATSASGLSHLEWYLRLHPDILILELGLNDAIRGLPISEIRDNLANVIERALQYRVKILLIGVQISGLLHGPDYARRFEEMYNDLATSYGVAFFPNILNQITGDPNLTLKGYFYPNAKGYTAIATALYPYVIALLEDKPVKEGLL